MRERPLKLGVLGAGMIATVDYGVLPNMGLIENDVDVVAIADPLLERAEQVARDFHIPKAFARLEDMLDGVELDAVLNLTPIPLHGASSRTILEAGKHLAMEKPLATNMEDADAIIEIAGSKGLALVVAPPNMLFPTRSEARRLVGEGAIGKVAFARVRASHGGPASGAWPNDPTWFYQKGSGPLFDMGVYGIHEITGILGPARRVVAFSGITEPVRTVRGGPFKGKRIEVTADDNTLLMLDFGGSTFAVVDGTFNVNGARSPKIEIFGREGTISIADGPAESAGLEVFRLDAVPGLSGWVQPTLREHAATQRRVASLKRAVLLDHLLDCVDGKPSVLSGEHARHALEIMLKADESARTGRALELTTTFGHPDAGEAVPAPAEAAGE
jgi:predicted dehydrogenase